MDMDNYAGQAISMYESVPGATPLKNNIHYPWLEPTIEQINNEAQENSGTVFGHCASSLSMQLLSAARSARVDMVYSINTLSRAVTG